MTTTSPAPTEPKPQLNKKARVAIRDIYVNLREGKINGYTTEELTAEKLTFPQDDGDTALHASARSGILGSLPTTVLKHQYLSARGGDHESVYHAALAANHFGEIPVHLHSEEMLLLTDSRRLAFIIAIVERGQLPFVQRSALTEKVLSSLDFEMSNVLLLAATRNQLHHIPDQMITHPLATAINMDGKSAIDFIDDSFQRTRIERLIWN